MLVLDLELGSVISVERSEMKTPPEGAARRADCQVREADQKPKPTIKATAPCFDTLVARYYCWIYHFALRITDDPLEALLLKHAAFKRARNQLRSGRDEIIFVRTLLAAVIQGFAVRACN